MLTLIKDSLPVSITLGLWSTLIIYLVSIPLGIRKAVYNGSRFDVWSSAFIIIGYAIPAFLFAILLIVFFAGGSYFDLFPLRGLVSANFDFAAVVSENHRLSVAYHAAGAGDSDWWLCGADHADQKLIP
ncbi:ABC transporter permease [Escherichia coli]|uniref:ABC transporter permease n=1 Tax=Escherichia coli TaxID=562 RepID=A0A376U7G5_ECOLX|nr:ABC transporter permease [Escherichia coli]